MGKNAIVGQSGGPTSVINASLAGVVEACMSRTDGKVYGMEHGIEGLLQGKVIDLSATLRTSLEIEFLKRTPSSYLGSCRYKLPSPEADEAVYQKLFDLLKKLDIGWFFYIGGNDSMDTIGKLADYGRRVGSDIRFMGVPKTIDNDLSMTDYTFGFQTAVQICTDAIDKLVTTAASHNRVFILEVMGRDAGWIALHSAIAGGADVCLIPEIPYDIEKIKAKIEHRYNKRHGYCIIVVAEGAKAKGGSVVGSVTGEVGYQHVKLGGVGEQLAADLKAAGVEHDIRYTILGHLQRGGTPIAFDRVLATEFGVRAMEFVMEGRFGQMVAYHHPDIVGIPLEEAVREQNLVAPDSRLVHTAKGVGIEFGD